MYEIRQFKPVLYLVVLLGILAFAVAAESPAAGALAGGAVLLNAWLVRSGRFVPLHRAVASTVTLLCLAFVLWQAVQEQTTAILAISQFLVLLHIVKLFEQRTNRDYAQLLILSLLLMVACAISTASLVFGILLITYLLVALYCCLLFHLKVESEEAKRAAAVPADAQPHALTLRQDKRYLSQSMRRLTGMVSVFSVATAALVFVGFPRSPWGPAVSRPFQASQALTGFSDQVSFQQVARITQNQQAVAHVKVWRGGKEYGSQGQPLLLRGLTLDTYSGPGSDRGGPWRWSRSRGMDMVARHVAVLKGPLLLASMTDGDQPRWRQKILLEPTGTNTLFSIAGASVFTLTRGTPFVVRFSGRDQSIQSLEPLTQQIEYEVLSSGSLGGGLVRRWSNRADRWFWNAAPQRSYIDPLVASYARRPEVSGFDRNGRSLAEQRQAAVGGVSPLDEHIASSIQDHLQNEFYYTLDLTDAKQIRGKDPAVAFLHDLKRGHCEYFAGAMTLLCQSLGMQARMVVGFRCDEFNRSLGQYLVRQSHAHAWVEVLTPRGWLTFDPTTARRAPGAEPVAREPGLWMRLKHWFDYIEYNWQDAVVAFDADTRQGVIQGVRRRLDAASIVASELIASARQWLAGRWWALSLDLLTALIASLVLAVAGLCGWYLINRSRLRRRAQRIGIEALPPGEQLRLARQLGFYDDLMRLLERQGIHRPRHLTPLEFAQSLVFLPNDAYHSVCRLTDLFYRIRFGDARLRPAQQRHVSAVVQRVDSTLRGMPASRQLASAAAPSAQGASS